VRRYQQLKEIVGSTVKWIFVIRSELNGNKQFRLGNRKLLIASNLQIRIKKHSFKNKESILKTPLR
jgi:hypothetical protein